MEFLTISKIPGLLRIFPAVTDIRAMRSSTEGSRLVQLFQTHVTFCSHLERLCDVEHACSSNVPGTTDECRVHYNPQLHTRSA
ncbi:hypothetical protein TNCV_4703611 [Trichonephila clavipes]|nr:hypothetical protein TNCV_4703611 [Trichonephila clavipes]